MVPRSFALTHTCHGLLARRPHPCLRHVRPHLRWSGGVLGARPRANAAAAAAAEPQPKWRRFLRGMRGVFAVAGTCALGFCYAEEAATYVREQVARLNGEELRVFEQHFANVMPHAEFEKLMRAGQRIHTSRRHVAIRKGDENAPLILVIDGYPEIEVEAGITIIGKPGLVGEMSFLTNAKCSATVYMTEGCRYHIWGRGTLRALLNQEQLVKAGLEAKAGHELIDRLTQTTKDLVRARYSLLVSHTALRYLLKDAKAGSAKFFAELAATRKMGGISDDVHRLVMEDFGLSAESAKRDRASIALLCASICSREVLPPQPEPPNLMKLEDSVL